jgi:hypothetical protein
VFHCEGGAADILCDRGCVFFDGTPILWDGTSFDPHMLGEDRVETMEARHCFWVEPYVGFGCLY